MPEPCLGACVPSHLGSLLGSLVNPKRVLSLFVYSVYIRNYGRHGADSGLGIGLQLVHGPVKGRVLPPAVDAPSSTQPLSIAIHHCHPPRPEAYECTYVQSGTAHHGSHGQRKSAGTVSRHDDGLQSAKAAMPSSPCTRPCSRASSHPPIDSALRRRWLRVDDPRHGACSGFITTEKTWPGLCYLELYRRSESRGDG